MPIATTRLIGSAEAADLLGVSRSTISRRVRDGILIPIHRMPGDTGAFLFDPAELLAHQQTFAHAADGKAS